MYKIPNTSEIPLRLDKCLFNSLNWTGILNIVNSIDSDNK